MLTLFPPGLTRRVSYLLLTLPLGLVYFGVLIGGLVSAVFGVVFIGLPLLVGLMFLWRALARKQRRLLARMLDVRIEDPYRHLRAGTRIGRVRERVSDPATWKDLADLLFIWLTTGAGYFWPQWSIAGWGFLLALHAWFARGRPAGMLAGETQPDR